ncbi:MAG: hypothetical protein ABEK03_08500 [Candidatus Bipolaricaulia bacterium]
MKSVAEFLIAIAVIIGMATAISSSITQPETTRSDVQATIDDLLSRDEVTLSAFVDALGEPKSVENTPCAGNTCIEATWDIGIGSNPCWKRLVVTLNEEERTIFMAEQLPIAAVGSKEEGDLRCVAVDQ